MIHQFPDIEQLIPQRAPMVMIDAMTHCDELTTSTKLEVRGCNIFVEDNHLTAEGMLESIAQTCAARIGYLNILAGATVKLGFIGAVKDYIVNSLAAVGEVIETTITVKEEIFGITLVDAVVESGGMVLATTTMKIALSDIDAQQG